MRVEACNKSSDSFLAFVFQTDLEWLGIGPSEGPSKPGQHGPYIQSHRLPIYHENLSTLVDSGHAYECFCTEKRLELMKREAVKSQQRPGYDNKCRDLSRDEVKRKKAAGEKFCVRFKVQSIFQRRISKMKTNLQTVLIASLFELFVPNCCAVKTGTSHSEGFSTW